MPPNPTCFLTGSCDTIRFMIGSTISINLVEAEVLAVPVGFTTADVFDPVIFTDGVVTVNVYDPIGCFFNEPDGQLIGRQGWARLMVPAEDSQGNVTQDPANPYGVAQWEVFALCCNTQGCV